MKQYQDLLQHVLDNGVEESSKDERTGTGTLSVFGTQTRYDLEDGFPLVTTKKVNFDAIVAELCWFLEGSTNTKRLNELGTKIWDSWAAENGELGPVYGKMWRSWPHVKEHGMGFLSQKIDQLKNVIEELKRAPSSRHLIVSTWNPGFLPDTSEAPHENAKKGKQALAPCHTLFQFKSYEIGGVRKLSLMLYQRSGDLFIGVPFNIASYAALLKLVAQMTGHVPHEFVHTIGDAHIYKNHIEQVEKQLKRSPKPLPTLKLDKEATIDNLTPDMFTLKFYKHHSPIKGDVAV